MRRRGLREQGTVALLLLFDLVWSLVAYGLAFAVRIGVRLPFTADVLPASRVFELRHMLPEILLAELAILYVFGFYDLRALRAGFRPVLNSVTALFVHLLATTSLYFFAGDVFFPRSVLVVYWLINAAGVASAREWVSRRLAASSPVRVLLVGTAAEVEQFLGGVGDPRLHHIDVVGAVAVGPDGGDAPALEAGPPRGAGSALAGAPPALRMRKEGAGRAPVAASASRAGAPDLPGGAGVPAGGPPWVGTLDDVPRLLAEHEIGEVVLLSPFSWRDRLVDRLLREPERPRVGVVPSVYDILVGRISSGRIHDVPLVEVVKNPRDDLAYRIKRVTDFAVAGALATALLPVALVAAVAVKLGSRGPVLYRQRRVGQGGVEFTIWKFRTMTDDAEGATGPTLAVPRDERVTRVGRVLRATRIDELPQLWNVLNGTMSLVGPRPERPEFVRRFAAEIPGYLERFQVRPGLTGLAQVNGEYHTSPAYKLKYDLAYIYNYSLVLDLKIMAETAKVMVTRRGL
jgi:lipopolysaccharide/colanic/teichoic acid biosynthesis glycosyltransferase